ncbi:questin oxidase family protein [Thalassomonas haliotis]|uniref:Questin oxidase family protein n=1 Tax=Thalassomonas haliotis TaxID=485448 RepID=A0ABY7VAQ7_9GAMM|nr:questin oxidase family protein [Thalassomonas haliotis]WDE10621.1 questin oxidase family protein [Thalassomonas haliotis]
MEDSKVLKRLLEQAGKYHPLYGGGLATHLPMVLIALDFLNAPKQKLESTFKQSLDGLELVASLTGVTAVADIEQDLGDSQKFAGYLKYFKTELASYGTHAVLKKSLPVLMPGIAASAFHALIRLAYAIEANNQDEIAMALAFWSAEYQPFSLSGGLTEESLENILTRLAPLAENYKFSPGIIVDRMNEIGELLQCRGCVIQPRSIELSAIRSLALKAFYANDDFTLLHAVTGCHAFSIIMPYLENIEPALKALWQAIVVAYLSTGLAYEDAAITPPEGHSDFTPVLARAIESTDAHVIKLAYTCFCEYTKFKEPLYYAVAQRAVLND